MINLNYLSGDVYQYNLFCKLVVEDMAKSTNTRRQSIDRSGVHTLSSVEKSWQQPSVKGEGCEGSSARNKVRDLASARWEPLAQRLRASTRRAQIVLFCAAVAQARGCTTHAQVPAFAGRGSRAALHRGRGQGHPWGITDGRF